MDGQKLFLRLIKAQLNNNVIDEEVKEKITTSILPMLFNISKKHDLVHLIANVLIENNLLPSDLEITKSFIKEQNLAVYRQTLLEYEETSIGEVFEKHQIKFIPLKGAVISLLYPMPWMRTRSDIDVYIDETNLEKAVSLFRDELGYEVVSKGDHDVSFTSKSGVHVELHYKLVDLDAKAQEKQVFNSVWENATLLNESKKCHYKMSNEYLYCYHVSHIAKHLRFGGCGVRFIIDTFLLNTKLEFDNGKKKDLLEKAGLLTLSNEIETLSKYWFLGNGANDVTLRLEQYVLLGGIYGSYDNKIAALQSRKKNKFAYLLSRVFLPYNQMAVKYENLKKCPILYPFYVVKRLFKLLSKNEREKALKEVETTSSKNANNQKNVAKLLNDLDLK